MSNRNYDEWVERAIDLFPYLTVGETEELNTAFAQLGDFCELVVALEAKHETERHKDIEQARKGVEQALNGSEEVY